MALNLEVKAVVDVDYDSIPVAIIVGEDTSGFSLVQLAWNELIQGVGAVVDILEAQLHVLELLYCFYRVNIEALTHKVQGMQQFYTMNLLPSSSRNLYIPLVDRRPLQQGLEVAYNQALNLSGGVVIL